MYGEIVDNFILTFFFFQNVYNNHKLPMWSTIIRLLSGMTMAIA